MNPTFADDELGGGGISHDQEKAALEVRLDLFDLSHIHEHFAARAKEHLFRQPCLQLGELIIYPKGIGLSSCLDDATFHFEPEDLLWRQQEKAVMFSAHDVA